VKKTVPIHFSRHLPKSRWHKPLWAIPALFLGLMGYGHAHAGADATHGASVFAQECAECHSMKAGKNKKGPSLFGVVGRQGASIADFSYSDALKQAGLSWTPEQLDAYIAHPKKVVAGGKMKYDGLDDAAARADLIAYLASIH
jgi:cytochrome c